jgi:rhodanese-related sulfurtransferase
MSSHTWSHSSHALAKTAAFVAVSALAVMMLTGCGLLAGPSVAPTARPGTPAPAAAAPATAAPAASTQLGLLAPYPYVRPVNLAATRKLVAEGARLVDVRPHADFKLERLVDAENIQLSDLADEADSWNPTDPVVLCGYHDAYAAAGAAYLKRTGFDLVYRLEGGEKVYDASFTGSEADKHLDAPRLYFFVNDSDPNHAALAPVNTSMRERFEDTIDFQTFNGDNYWDRKFGTKFGVTLWTGTWVGIDKDGQETWFTGADKLPAVYAWLLHHD